jgi:hypothetical protein
MLLAQVERRLGLADRLARLIPDRRDPTRVTHSLADLIRARILGKHTPRAAGAGVMSRMTWR